MNMGLCSPRIELENEFPSLIFLNKFLIVLFLCRINGRGWRNFDRLRLYNAIIKPFVVLSGLFLFRFTVTIWLILITPLNWSTSFSSSVFFFRMFFIVSSAQTCCRVKKPYNKSHEIASEAKLFILSFHLTKYGPPISAFSANFYFMNFYVSACIINLCVRFGLREKKT